MLTPTTSAAVGGLGAGGARGAAWAARESAGSSPYWSVQDRLESARTPRERARAAAEELVAIGLVQPALKSLRESNRSAAPFAPGDAERRFGPMLDQQIAERVVRSSNFPLVDRVADGLLRRLGEQGGPSRG